MVRLRLRLLSLLVLVAVIGGWKIQVNPVDDLPVLAIGGVLLAPLIVGVIGVAKKLGLPTHAAPYLNGLLSVLGYGVIIYLQMYPANADVVMHILNALTIFLAAAGFYDRTQGLGQRVIGTMSRR